MYHGEPMGHVFHRNPLHSYPVAVAGDGAYLYDREGRRYLDASGGAAVSCLGHSDRAVIEAIQRQLEALPFAHTSFFSNEPMEALADALIDGAPRPLDKVYFTSGGSEATEAALKLARQYFVEKGEPQRAHVIGRRQSYHGNTLGALAVGGNLWRRRQYEPLLIGATHVSPCYAYRDQRAGETAAAYVERLGAELEAEIVRLGGNNVIAFVAETVAGATLGAAPPVPGYFRRVREICDRLGELLEQSLRGAFGEHPHVGDIRGRGLFWALELVAERRSKQPFDPVLQMHARIKQAALDAGLLCYPMGGTLDGVRGDHVLLAPPFIVEPAQIEELVHKLGRSLESALINT